MVWFNPLRLLSDSTECTRVPRKTCTADDVTLGAETTTSRVLFGTVRANWAEMMFDAVTDSRFPEAEPICKDSYLLTWDMTGTRRTRAAIQATMMSFLRPYTNRPSRLNGAEARESEDERTLVASKSGVDMR
jgi:hypothetical protein